MEKLGLRRCSRAGFEDYKVKALISALVFATAAEANDDVCKAMEIYNKKSTDNENNYLLLMALVSAFTVMVFGVGCFFGRWLCAGRPEEKKLQAKEAATQTDPMEEPRPVIKETIKRVPLNIVPQEIFVAPAYGQK